MGRFESTRFHSIPPAGFSRGLYLVGQDSLFVATMNTCETLKNSKKKFSA